MARSTPHPEAQVVVRTLRPSAGESPQAVPVVIVPGIGMSHRYSRRLHRLLGRTRVAHSLDLPGFAGQPSGGGSPQMSVAERAAAIADALDERGIGPALFVGHSMGVQFVVELARIRPELVTRIVALAPVVDPRRRTARQQALGLAHDLAFETPSATALTTADYLRTGLPRFFGALTSMLEFRTDEAAAQIGCAMLVVRGEHDPIARRPWCEDLAEIVPSGRLVEIAGAGHVLQHTHPEQVAAAIEAFAGEAAVSPSGRGAP